MNTLRLTRMAAITGILGILTGFGMIKVTIFLEVTTIHFLVCMLSCLLAGALPPLLVGALWVIGVFLGTFFEILFAVGFHWAADLSSSVLPPLLVAFVVGLGLKAVFGWSLNQFSIKRLNE